MTGDAATFEKDAMLDGLELTAVGMGVVFAVLAILAISIKIFDRIESMVPSGKTAGEATGSAPKAAPEVRPTTALPMTSNDAETAAAIAVALALADSEQVRSAAIPPSGSRASSSGAWLTTGRNREMSRRMPGQPARNRGRQ